MGCVCYFLHHSTGLDNGFYRIQRREFVYLRMVQEIITYTIVLLAVVFSAWKIYHKLAGKKRKTPKGSNVRNLADKQVCMECVETCALRDAPPSVKESNPELCATAAREN